MLRARKLGAGRGAGVSAAMVSAYAEEAFATVERAARRVLAASAEGDTLGVQMAVLRRFSRMKPVDAIAVDQTIARHFLEAGRYRL